MRFNRREAIAGVAGSLAVAAASQAVAGRPGARPNILFILADDLGYADLSCYGRRDYQTPVLDRLAADGLLMTQGYANSAVCSPTRVALITGRYHQRLVAGLAEPIQGQDRREGLLPGHPTLPSLLKSAGYRTSLVGKWHLGWPPEFGPLRFGYDRFFGIAPGAADHLSHRLHGRVVNPPVGALYEGDAEVSVPGYLTDLLAARAVSEIGRLAKEQAPFLLSLHFTAPHWPWQGPNDAVLPETIAIPESHSSLRHDDGGSLEKFAEMVAALDAGIGRVLAELDARGLSDNTIVVFTSDNGGERFSDTWPLRGGKGELLEGGIRVPLIARWPGRIAPGGRTDQVMTSMDWLPTLLAAAGATVDPQFPPDGENLLDVITGAASPRPRTLFWRFRKSEQAAVRDGDWKFLRMDGQEALFDIRKDPRERANLRYAEPARFERLREAFAAWDKTMLPYPPKPVPATAQ